MTENGLQYHVLPDDPAEALNILRETAGLEPLAGAGHRADMKEPRKLRPVTIEGPLRYVPVEEWASATGMRATIPMPRRRRRTRGGRIASAATYGAS